MILSKNQFSTRRVARSKFQENAFSYFTVLHYPLRAQVVKAMKNNKKK